MKPFIRKSLLLLLVSFIAAAQPVFACPWKCEHTIDGDNCKNAGRPVFNGAESCVITTECTIILVDPDGPGGQAPSALIQCRYPCKLEYCLWV
ncbi:MAG TPA: hypothetical protein VEK11_23425 [Thermoanaerobaculia bacterium]|nr:hypothetical protein [Thermoanaerobaculia bacterium]